MIDPDGIIITKTKATPEIKIGLIPTCDFETYDLENDKSFAKYISDIESEVRGSFEYRQFINYLRNYMDMNRCAYLEKAFIGDTYNIRIEIHHYPFSLYDIVNIVYNKRVDCKESLEVEMVAKEVMELHYKCMVGLIPLSETIHKLVHNGKLFIPLDKVYGRYDLFMTYYDPYITSEHKDIINRIEKYTEEQVSDLLDTSILNKNNLTFNIADNNYALPQFNTITEDTYNRIETIKNNSYTLPTVHDKILIESKDERKPIINAIYSLDE